MSRRVSESVQWHNLLYHAYFLCFCMFCRAVKVLKAYPPTLLQEGATIIAVPALMNAYVIFCLCALVSELVSFSMSIRKR